MAHAYSQQHPTPWKGNEVSLLDEARAQTRRPGPPCSVQRALAAERVPAEQIAELLRAHDVPVAEAGRTFRRRKVDITDGTVSRHRLGKCVCCSDLGVSW